MTREFFLKYLAWFDSQMVGRKVLLLIDGFSAHEYTVKRLLEDKAIPSLVNTRVEFLCNGSPRLPDHTTGHGYERITQLLP